ncbi:flippase [Thermosulfurimonas marina]|uniref:Flippase n=1 Tax=Thermosulfurimonas marina TaxID=2047767 RepID=A0A6H1WRW6_9BACT|nr:flippase [Thermosulfurimonas marina]QJA05899.1 flippase [Thermosulfurimonas marina]
MIDIPAVEKFKARINGDPHLKELIKGSLTFFVLRVLGFAVAYIFTLSVTRNLGAGAWGIFALCLTVLQITSVIGRLGLDTALLRFIAQYNAQGKGATARSIYLKSLILVVPFSLSLSVALYFLAPVLSEKVFGKSYLTPYLRFTVLAVIPFVLLYINSESLRAFKKIKEYTIFQNLLPFLIALFFLGIFFTYLHIKSTEAVIYAYVIGIGIAFLLSSLLLQREFVKTNGIREDISLRDILSVSFPMLMSSSLSMIMSWTDTIMLGMWRTEEEVGIYNVAVRLSTITSFTLMAINSIAAPKFAEFWGKNDLEGLKKVAQQSTKLIFWNSAPILVLYIFFPEFFMGIFGEEFKKGAMALVILSLGQFVNAASGSVGYILNMTNNQRILLYTALLSTLVNIVLNFILIPKYGLLGAAISTAITVTLWNILCILYLKVNYKLRFFYLPNFLERRCF